MNLYQVDIPVIATAYIKADSIEEARLKLAELHLTGLELGEDSYQEVPISGASYDNPDLPNVSLSPAMTIHVEPQHIAELTLSEEGVPAHVQN